MTSKTIILSKPNLSKRAILTLYLEDDLLKCKLRLYNNPQLNTTTKLGLYHNDEVYSANLLEKNGVYLSSFVGNFDMEKDFYCALVDTAKENQILLSGGTYSGYFLNEDDIFSQEGKNNEPESIQSNNSECVGDCGKCPYKEFFFANSQTQAERFKEEICEPVSNPNKISNTKTPTEEAKKSTIIPSLENEIIPHFETIFATYPIDETLTSLVEGGKFVRLNEGDSVYYIGTVTKNDKVQYICYAKKAAYNAPVPEELGEHFQWLPLNKSDPLSDGYYIVFQDISDLKIVEFN